MSESGHVRMLEAAADVVGRLAEVLGGRLTGAAVYGSAVTGDVLPGMSDLDIALFLDDELGLDAAHRAHQVLRGVDLGGAAYLQLHTQLARERKPLLVPNSYRWLRGVPADGVELDADQLAASGADWLSKLPTLLAKDHLEWAAAIGRTNRQVRLLLTRLKPSVRAVLVSCGEPPLLIWAAGWPVLVERWSHHDAAAADLLDRLLTDLRGPVADEDAAGLQALALIERIVDARTDQLSAPRRTLP